MTSIPSLLLAATVLLVAGGSKPSPLKSVEFAEVDRVPYEIEVPINEQGPAPALCVNISETPSPIQLL